MIKELVLKHFPKTNMIVIRAIFSNAELYYKIVRKYDIELNAGEEGRLFFHFEVSINDIAIVKSLLDELESATIGDDLSSNLIATAKSHPLFTSHTKEETPELIFALARFNDTLISDFARHLMISWPVADIDTELRRFAQDRVDKDPNAEEDLKPILYNSIEENIRDRLRHRYVELQGLAKPSQVSVGTSSIGFSSVSSSNGIVELAPISQSPSVSMYGASSSEAAFRATTISTVTMPPSISSTMTGSSSTVSSSSSPLVHDEDPVYFCCPITQVLMKNPVFSAGTGRTYEEAAIAEWFERCKKSAGGPRDPLTNKPITDTGLVPNYNLKDAIDDYVKRKAAIAPEAALSSPIVKR